MEIKSYKNLIVWQKAMELADEIYKLTQKFPDNEKYGLISQMRRSAISIPSNIAEGYRRNSKGSYIQFLLVAYGSGGELETQIELCKRNLNLDQTEYEKVENLLEEVMKMLNKLISNLRTTAYDLRAKEGVAALPTILVLGGLVTEIIISVVATSYLFIESEFGNKLSADAFLAAKAGAADAIMKVVRDKTYTSATTTLAVGNYSADVFVCRELPCFAVGKHKIISVGKAQTRRRSLEVILDVDSATGEVRLESLKEVQL